MGRSVDVFHESSMSRRCELVHGRSSRSPDESSGVVRQRTAVGTAKRSRTRDEHDQTPVVDNDTSADVNRLVSEWCRGSCRLPAPEQ